MRYPKPENIAKLSPEQLKVWEKWLAEGKAREALLDKLDAGQVNIDEVSREILENNPEFCEHNRSIWSPCSACYEIDKILFPESFDEDGNHIEYKDHKEIN